MTTNPTPEPAAKPGWQRTPALAFLFGVFVFGTAHTQAPLYYSNQNQYFLHGLAQGGLGDLKNDWLANTTDPTPVFSLLVEFTYHHLHPWAFHAYYAILLGLYFVAMMGLVEFAYGGRMPLYRWLVAAFVLCILHSAALRFGSVRGLGHDYPWYLQSGVAGQYLLGPGLQPSAFGVLLLVSLHLLVVDRPLLAALCASLAVVMHATYAPIAATLVLGYLVVLHREKRLKLALKTAMLSLIVSVPVVVWQVRAFAPTAAETFSGAQEILVHFRIPHHTLPAKWFNWIAALQILLILTGLLALGRTRLFPAVAVVFAISTIMTLAQIAVENDTLALLFPWRASALLVPVAIAALLGRLVSTTGPASSGEARLIGVACIVGCVVLVFAGVAIMQFRLAYQMNSDEEPLLAHVQEHHQPGEVYLLPVKAPAAAQGKRGVPSTSFTQPPRQDKDRNLIAVDFQRFRFDTGAAIVVDFKSIPYKDVDVLEWRERLRVCEWLYQQPDWNAPDVRDALKKHGATHVVATANQVLSGKNLVLEYRDPYYRIYRVTK